MPAPHFELLRSRQIATLNLEAREYRDTQTGARHLHLAADDPNNVFCVGFLTAPEDSTGVAHILEHTVLCGGERFPVRDPFFMMLRRSLNTFMNAFTGPDWTAFPFASLSRKDFDNLLEVYLDAAFFPRLYELDFAQEGWRIEFERPGDLDSDLIYKGVVFNEMKGAMGAPHARLWQILCTALYPTAPYRFNSGGEPSEIPKLSYRRLVDFHRRHYHPSNALFATYGNFPEREHQDKFHQLALSRFEARKETLCAPCEHRFDRPQTVAASYASPGEQQASTHIVIGWLLSDTRDLLELLRMHLLAGVLLDNSACPLQHALETSPLGTSPSELNGLSTSTREAIFVCGLEGSEPPQADAIESLVLAELEEVAAKGVAKDLLDAVLHQLELEQREIPIGRYPYGLRLIETALPMALHGGDPIAALDIDPLIDRLRRETEQPGFIQALARRLLLENRHRIRVVMAPDERFAEQEAWSEGERLRATKLAMSANDKAHVVVRAAALAERQAEEDDPHILPRVGLEDVPPDLHIPEGHPSACGGLPCTWYPAATNGLVHEDLVATLPQLGADELQLLPLYCDTLTHVGVGALDYRQVQAWQARVSGGIDAQCNVTAALGDIRRIHAVLRVQSHGLARNHAALAELLQHTFGFARFDELQRLRELVAQARGYRESAVTDHGHTLAITAASSPISPAAFVLEKWNGLTSLRDLKGLDKELKQEESLLAFSERLKTLHGKLIRRIQHLLVVGEASERERYLEELNLRWASAHFNAKDMKPLSLAPDLAKVHQAWLTSTGVNFCARAYPTVPADHSDAPALAVLGQFLQNGYLHNAVREKGGAYGSGAGYDAATSAFHFFSYRDPRLAATLADFDHSLSWLRTHRHRADSLEETILSVVAAIDKPGSPATEAITAFYSELNGRTAAHRRRFRKRVLSVKMDDLQRVASEYLSPEYASTAVLCSAKAARSEAGGFEVYEL
ncbi:MAG: insulinase family protein [Gammaproteobacteria bacterium]